MQELKAGVTDAAVEKHVPVYTVEGNYVHVVVGETKHHIHISFVVPPCKYINTQPILRLYLCCS